MHWSEKLAERIIARNPNKEIYTCAAGISPSGSIHIGNFRDVATSLFVVKALHKKGKKARLLFSWDEFDRLRKIPKNVIDLTDEKCIGMPYSDVPNPYLDSEPDVKTYAKHFELEFETALKEFGIEVEFRYQTELYRSGAYKESVKTALEKRGEIFDILESFRTKGFKSESKKDTKQAEVTELENPEDARANYYPVAIYCPICKKDNTKITNLSDGCSTAEYVCKCGHNGKVDFNIDFNLKLAWKIDWPMRWKFEEVDFEPGGKDHASPTGSYQTSKIISERIFDYEAPIFQGYEFIGLKGAAGKMSGSSGLNLTPAQLVKIYQPEVILWLYAKSEPLKQFDFCFDDGILRQYHEFDGMLSKVRAGNADDLEKIIMEFSEIKGHALATVPLNLLVQLGSIVNFDAELIKTLFNKIGYNFTIEEINSRLENAENWLDLCAPEKRIFLLNDKNKVYYEGLSASEKAEISQLYKYLSIDGYDLDALQTELYDIVKRILSGETGENIDALDKNAVKKRQAKFFANVYNLLIGKDAGPRLYLFLFAVDKNSYLKLLNF